MRGSFTILTLIMGALTLAPISKSTAGEPPRHMQLLETGDFHSDEVVARSGEKWLGLDATDRGSTLLTFRLKVETIYDDITDYQSGQSTGKRVSVNLPLKPLFLLQGANMLREGPVTTVFKSAVDFDQTLEKSGSINLKLAGNSYVLKVAGADGSSEKCRETAFPPNANLVLTLGEATQTLYSLGDCGNDPSWFLLWAGDLDHDGKIDLYVSVTQHYNVSERKLFLSSQASEGELVKEVAEFVTSGC